MLDHHRYMIAAINEAEKCIETGDVPIGCVVVSENKIIASARNMVEAENDPTKHAEMIAIEKAVNTIGDKYLSKCDIYVTLEPCSMCSGAIVLSRFARLIFGAYDLKTGASGSLYNITHDKRLNHQCEVLGGIMEDECSKLLKEFFKGIRK